MDTTEHHEKKPRITNFVSKLQKGVQAIEPEFGGWTPCQKMFRVKNIDYLAYKCGSISSTFTRNLQFYGFRQHKCTETGFSCIMHEKFTPGFELISGCRRVSKTRAKNKDEGDLFSSPLDLKNQNSMLLQKLCDAENEIKRLKVHIAFLEEKVEEPLPAHGESSEDYKSSVSDCLIFDIGSIQL